MLYKLLSYIYNLIFGEPTPEKLLIKANEYIQTEDYNRAHESLKKYKAMVLYKAPEDYISHINTSLVELKFVRGKKVNKVTSYFLQNNMYAKYILALVIENLCKNTDYVLGQYELYKDKIIEDKDILDNIINLLKSKQYIKLLKYMKKTPKIKFFIKRLKNESY